MNGTLRFSRLVTFVRRDERCILITSMFIAAVGSYLILPYYSIHATQGLGLPLSEVAVLLTCIALCERGMGIGGGFLVDRAGAKTVILAGLVLRVISLVILAFAADFTELLVAALTSGSGTALFQIGGKTVLLARADNVRSFALRNIALNVGVAIGPLFGYLLVRHAFREACLLNAALFALIFCYGLFLPSGASTRASNKTSPTYGKTTSLLTPKLVYLYIAQTLFFFFYVNFELTLPLFARARFGLFWVGSLFTINAIVVVLLSFPMAAYARRHQNAIPKGFAGLAAAFLSFYLASIAPPPFDVVAFVAGVGAFSVCEVFFMLAIELLMSGDFSGAALGRILGASALASALGVTAGNLSLGPLYASNTHASQFNFWFILSIGCLLAFFGMTLGERWMSSAAARSND